MLILIIKRANFQACKVLIAFSISCSSSHAAVCCRCIYSRPPSKIAEHYRILYYRHSNIVYFLVLILKKLIFGAFIKHLLISPNFNILLNHGTFELYSLAAVVEIVIYDTTAVFYCLDITPPYALTEGIKLT